MAPLWRMAASFMSPKKSVQLLEDTPSVPRQTLTPALPMAGTGAMPLPSLRLLMGLWMAETPLDAITDQSSGVVQTQWAAMARTSHTP